VVQGDAHGGDPVTEPSLRGPFEALDLGVSEVDDGVTATERVEDLLLHATVLHVVAAQLRAEVAAEELPFPPELVVVDVLGPEVADCIVDAAVLEPTCHEAVDELPVRRRPVEAHLSGRNRLRVRAHVGNDDAGPRYRDRSNSWL
jgi:hypothetical protein